MSSRAAPKIGDSKGQPKLFVFIGLVAVVVVVAAGILLAARGSLPARPEVSAAEASALRDQGALFLDVRTAEEWNTAHVQGSTSIPLDQLASRVNELPRDRQIVVVCATGVRARAGQEILARAGFTKVAGMTGGLHEWQAEGYPTIAGP